MNAKRKPSQTVRWALSLALVVLGLLITWAWGQAAELAAPAETAPVPPVQYAVWQAEGQDRPALYRIAEQGAQWEALTLPGDATVTAWAGDGQDRLAVALSDGRLLVSTDRGQNWAEAAQNLPALSLAWSDDAVLYAGTERQGVYRLAAGGQAEMLPGAPRELTAAPVLHVAVAGGRLFAATSTAVFYTDDGQKWTKSLPVPETITALAVTGRDTVFVGTATVGVYRSPDAGQTWQPALEGLGLAAGQAVEITALEADPREPGVLYAAVNYVVGSTDAQASAEGTFVTLDGGQSWQRLAGPGFPEARPASDLVTVPDRPLAALAVTDAGLQSYTPDIAAAFAALQGEDAATRARAARFLGLAQAKEAGPALVDALDDPDPAVSLAASEALGRIDDPALVGRLMVALDHPDEQVRLGAARTLGLMKTEAAVDKLRAMLLNGQGAAVSVAAEALGRLGTPAATDALLAALADREMTPRRHAALAAIEEMGSAAVAPLARVLESGGEGYARRNAAEALGWTGSAQATPVLSKALRDRDETVRQQAAWALGEIGGAAAVRPLERAAARDASPEVQAEAQAALARVESQPEGPAARAPETASTLGQLEPARWLVLIGFWAAAAWLALTGARLAPAAVENRRR